MTTNNNTAELFIVGSLVTIHNSGCRRGRIIEYRSSLGPGGARIYRVLVRGKPKPAYIELKDQLEVISNPN